jgi:shikimate dehydrogenase
VELALAGAARITIVNRTPDRGQPLVDVLAAKTAAAATLVEWQGEYSVPTTAEVLINATSIGLNAPNARVPVAVDSLRGGLVVADVVFNPPWTRFLAEAQQHGCTTLDGLGMLVNQAAVSFAIWTGVKPDAGVMREALEEFLGL